MTPGPMPPQGPPDGAPPQPPSVTPAPPEADPQGQSPAMKFVSMANDGLMGLGNALEQAKGQVSPQEMQKFSAIVTAFHSFIDELSGGGGEQAPKPQAAGPIDAMAGKNSIPLPQG